MKINKVNLAVEVEQLKEFWKLKKIAEVNDHVVNIVKIKGEFEMHIHDNGEKLFYVLGGVLYIEFLDGGITKINAGEFIVVPGDVQHKPYSTEETTILFFESSKQL